jgi:hypothetical protein
MNKTRSNHPSLHKRTDQLSDADLAGPVLLLVAGAALLLLLSQIVIWVFL